MNYNQTMVKMVLDRWYALLQNSDTFLAGIPDHRLLQEVAPGKNRGIYLLGHLIAVHDDMIPLLDIGTKLYPALSEPFIKSPDKTVAELPTVQELRDAWSRLHGVLKEKLGSVQTEQWFEKHTAVSAEDFAKEPHRNKLNIIITRTTHLSYHLGQLILLQ